MRARISWLSVMALLAACGGGGGGSNTPTVTAPSNLSYPSPAVFMVSQPITALNPTVTGSVTSYAVSPALPAGVTISSTTGVISGTPTTPATTATYTVTASNTSGATTAGVAITVNDAAPDISYSRSAYTFTSGVPTTSVIPINSGGTVISWSINSALPAELTFNTTNGSISGTPTTPGAAATYSITAQNVSGSDRFDLTIAVDSGVLLDLGHSDGLVSIRRSGNRILSIDRFGHWVLWNASSTASLARGDVTCTEAACEEFVDLAANTLVVRVGTGLEVRDASDGDVIATLATTASWWKLATTGSYVAAGTASGITAWARTGQQLLSRSGNYESARTFAAPTELRVANGAAGPDRLETIVLATAVSTSAQFNGQFHSWFRDGARFLTTVANTVWVYSASGTQEDLRALPAVDQLTGQGDWFWIARNAPGQLDIYSVGASASPAASFPLTTLARVVPSANTIGILEYGDPDFSIVDLAAVTPVKTDHTQPLIYASAYCAGASGEWLIGNASGVVAASSTTPSSTRYFGFGEAWAIAANAERIAVATASGSVLYFSAATRQLEGTIDFSSSKLQLSADGTVLAGMGSEHGAQYARDRTLKIFSLPLQTVLREEPYEMSIVPWAFDFSLSASGQVFGRVLSTAVNGSTISREVYPVNGGAIIWSDALTNAFAADAVPIHLSPNGSLIAAPDGGESLSTATNIFVNGVHATAVLGMAVGWIDDDRLLIHRYVGSAFPPRYNGSIIVNGAGQQIRSLTLPNMKSFQTVDSERIYAPQSNLIVSLLDGETLWSSPNISSGQGGTTATHVIFAAKASVRAEPY
ncbi:Ig domain-containing protein [Steroidobacter sp.]|uniref:Ig domain-containing protein n=1 Tax=Steroidobacter sp. TaxID=1978227 RepID=UPI001A544723|nr:Ig domain-containing protein [Steroidobacter sp.]MBL8265333.1 putative Ig domain-containing protein [Steroidobacter sp.]